MRQIVPDGGKSFLFIPPTLGKIGLAASGRAHTVENSGRNGLELGLGGAYHVDRYACRLSKLRDILRGHHAGIVRAVREHYDHLSSRTLAGILTRQQQRVIRSEERRVGKECRSRWSKYY